MSEKYYQTHIALTIITKKHPLNLSKSIEFDMDNSDSIVISNVVDWDVITKESANQRIVANDIVAEPI